ncbi:MAG: hypothetical protein MJH10_12320 [Epibacterium sp.]|nr:hypothetical protein [Epibacterium sp.]NQX74334.1 hypothetical protein [Epibacterium sp.]
MSTGKVIGGKLAIRNGRLACDCCDQEPGPTDGCLPCGDFTSYFGGCYSPTSDPPDPIVPGCDATDAWDKPIVSGSASWLWERLAPVPTVLRQFSGSFNSMTVCRSAACSVFEAGQDLDVGNGETWTLLVSHLPGQLGGNCDQLPSNNNYNLRASLSNSSSVGSPGFAGYLATRDGSACLGTGFLLPQGGQSNIVMSSGAMSGNCPTKQIQWSGIAEYLDGFGRPVKETMSLQVSIRGLAGCPEELVV